MSNFRRTTQTVNGFDIATWQAGSGPTLLFLHGEGGAATFFDNETPAPFLRGLAERFTVLVPEHPGFGAQDRPDWLDSIHDLAYFYLDYLATAGLSNVHLVGQGIGGWIAMELAIRNTTNLASLTLAGAAGLRVKGVAPADIFLWSPREVAENLLRDPAQSAGYLAHLTRERSELELREFLRNRETLALLAWQPRLFSPDLPKWLHRITIPTHVIWAEEDRMLPLPIGEAIAAAIPGARLSTIPDSFHLAHLDQPEAFARTVSGFITEHAP